MRRAKHVHPPIALAEMGMAIVSQQVFKMCERLLERNDLNAFVGRRAGQSRDLFQ